MLTIAHGRSVFTRASVSALGALCFVVCAGSATEALGGTRYVNAGGDFQAALNAAQPGDEIVLEAGARFTGNFTLPVKPSGPSITIRSSASLPARRITPADAALMPVVWSGNTMSALAGNGTANWVIDGVQFLPNVDGHGDVIQLQDATNITLDRVLLVVPEGQQQKRGIRGNGRNVTLTRSHIAGVWRSGQDSQAFCAWDGAGPYTITDNYLEAASENVMFGGATSKSTDRIPSDILVERNHFSKPLSWKGQPRNVKNLFELKQAKRAVIRNNLFERNWTDGQTGWAIVFKSMNDDGGAPWAVTEDVLFERNIVRDTERGISVVGYDPYQPSGQTTRVTIRHNLIQTSGEAFKVGVEAGELTVDHNTVVNGWTFATLYTGSLRLADGSSRAAQYSAEKLTVTNNLAYHQAYGVKGDGTAIGTPSLEAFTNAYTWTHNVLAGDSGWGKPYPPITWQPAIAEHEANFNPDYSLVSTSTYRNTGTDGLDLGAVTGGGATNPAPPPPPDEVCGDSLDNDGDGQADEGCAPPPAEVCGDGVDNDGDSSIDEGCPPPLQEVCGDNTDNDGDGQADEGCPLPQSEVCGDSKDNDADGQVDEGCVVMPVDTTGPAVTLWNWTEARNFIKFRVEASDPSGIANVRVEINGTVVTESTNSTVQVTIPLQKATTTSCEVKVFVTDRVGNVTVTSRAVQLTTSRTANK